MFLLVSAYSQLSRHRRASSIQFINGWQVAFLFRFADANDAGWFEGIFLSVP